MIPPSCSFLALPHLQIFKLDFSDLFSKTPTVTAWSAVLAYSLVMIFDIGECCCIGFFLRASAVGHGTHTHTHTATSPPRWWRSRFVPAKQQQRLSDKVCSCSPA